MNRRQLFIIMGLVLAMAALAWGINPAYAGPGTLATPPAPDYPASATPSGGTFFANSPLGPWQYVNALGTYSSATSNSGTPLRKFVDSLPGLGSGARPAGTALGANNLGQYIPIATPDTATYAGSDYYEIGLRDYTKQMHSDLPKATKLRGYYQKNGPDTSNQYLGPLLLATKNKPVRIKFTNELGVNGAGDLFIPVDTTYMGAGVGPDGVNKYTENRATLHLHGGHTPWISDGTPHQWIVPALETSTTYTRGVSQQNVPDMPDPGAGAATFFWTNNQSGRLMFYHDHAYGITRLNVYAGEAAGYLIVDPTEEDALATAGVPGTLGTTPDLAHLIPLIIQDKTFVPQDIAVQDAKWTNANWGSYGDLWFPHVYETNQWPTNPDLSGANNFGRWDYGPWFWPIFPVAIPGLPTMDVSGVPESFMDTPIVNGTAYPYLDVQPTAYRLRILNACNDRYINLSLFTADTSTGANFNNGYPTEVKMVDAVPRPACSATLSTNCTCTGAPGTPVGCFPPTWPTDGRIGGVPDPATAGPPMIQIGTESGLLPAPAVIDPQPVNYVYNRRNIIVLDISDQALLMGPAERADVIVDFSAYAGKTVILYNDAPAPNPGFDPRFDYFTGDPDNTWMGGAPSTLPGYGPNTRTIMQFRVASGPTASFNSASLNAALPAIYVASQPAPVVPQTFYPVPYNATTDTYARISDTSLSFTSLATGTTVTMPLQSKAIQELFTLDYGRMNATLGVELPFTNAFIQTTIPLGYVDPATEIVTDGQPQLWKITHNGVDTHAIHFHLFDVQLINRIGWDGAIYPPDPNELGWKDTVKMHPLEDIVVALRPTKPPVPFTVPNSVRPLDPTQPLGSTMNFSNIDPLTGNAPPTPVTNEMTDFGWEYVWHCHLLGHEENDMMRPVVLQVQPVATVSPTTLTFPTQLVGTSSAAQPVTLSNTGSGSLTINSITISGLNPGDFAQTNTCGPLPATLAPGGSCVISVTFTPTAAGARTAGVDISTNDPVNPLLTVSLNGMGTVVRLSPAALVFGNQLVGTISPSQFVTMSNTGTTALTINSITITGTNAGDYLISSTTCGASLAAGGNCRIYARFKPTAIGLRVAAISINDSDPASPQTVPLSGTGIAPVLTLSPTALSFSSTLTVTSAPQTVTVSNTGTAPMTINGISLTGSNPGQFAQTNTCGPFPATLAPGGSCTADVTFTPSTVGTGTKSASLRVSVAAPATTQSVSLTGTVIAPILTVSPTSLSFGNQTVGTTSAPQTVTVTNMGAAAMTINSIKIGGLNPGQFAQTNTCGPFPATLAPGASCMASVTFTPTSVGAMSASLNVNVASPAVSKSVSLTGTGQ